MGWGGREVGDKIQMDGRSELDLRFVRWRRPKEQKQKFCGDRWSQCDVDAWLGGLGDL